jgi:hypothetical protein
MERCRAVQLRSKLTQYPDDLWKIVMVSFGRLEKNADGAVVHDAPAQQVVEFDRGIGI